MNLPVYLYGHPVLRAENAPLSPSHPNLKELIDNMFQTMYNSEGVGLAAPQIGLNIQLVVIDADPVADQFAECRGRKMVLINPEVEVLDGAPVSRAEGCLSIPGISENVSRTEHIRLTWLDEDFKPHSEEISGFLARIVQHECDHLDGTVFTDHVSGIRRQLIRAKLTNIAKGKVHPGFPCRTAPKH